jgi:hypothetical protein
MTTKKNIHYAIANHFAAQGDHLGAQHADPDKRIVPGHGTVGARQVVARHANTKSACTDCADDNLTLAETSARGATNIQIKGA